MFEWYPEKWRVGKRTVKTGVAAGLCVLLFHLLNRGTPALACIAAVFSLRSDVNTSLYYGARRVMGTLLGGILSVLLVIIKQATGYTFFVDVFGIALFVIIFIVLSNVFNTTEGIIGGVAAFFIIYFNISPSNSIGYAFNRVLDTLIGASVAAGVNAISPPKPST